MLNFLSRSTVAVLISIGLFAIVFVSPESANAQLVAACEGNECNFCHVVELANSLIAWLIGIVIILAFALMAVAGVKLVISGGNQTALDDAKKMFQNVVIGFIIVLAAWLIVDTVMKTLLDEGMVVNDDLKVGRPWNQIECVANPEVQEAGIVREGADAPGLEPGVVQTPVGDPGEGLTHASAIEQLNSSNFSVVSSGSCTDKNQRTCTSLDGVKPLTIQRANELQALVGAPLVITGGTEVGHSTRSEFSHSNGYKLDFRTTPELNNYIQTNFTSLGNNRYRDSNGNVYWRHGPDDHWDVTITR